MQNEIYHTQDQYNIKHYQKLLHVPVITNLRHTNQKPKQYKDKYTNKLIKHGQTYSNYTNKIIKGNINNVNQTMRIFELIADHNYSSTID